AHALRITDARAGSVGGNIEAHWTVGIIDAAAEGQSSAANLRGDIFKKQTGSIEHQVAIDIAEAGRKVDGARLGVCDVDFAGDAPATECNFESGVDLSRS